MKRVILCAAVLVAVLFFSSASGSAVYPALRLHVIANSDTQLDQEVKLKIRDEILKTYTPLFSADATRSECRDILAGSLDEVEAIASGVLEEEGMDMPVAASLAVERFPARAYGDTLYPQGRYEALRVVIGEGSGRNWWCVMFPPLCVVDTSGKDGPKLGPPVELMGDGSDQEEKIEVRSRIWDWLFNP